MPIIKSCLKPAVRNLLYIPAVKNSIESIPVIRKVYPPAQRIHPIDKIYGIHTSGLVSVDRIHPDPSLRALISPYGGSQPSIVRLALSTLGNVSDYAFVDLGCGKGRVTTVASEYGFREVIGVELSVALAATARANGSKVALQFPNRPKVSIVEGNVMIFPIPPGKLAFFNYHAFGLEMVTQMVGRFEAALVSGELPHMFFVYYNPVHPEALDASQAFSRFYVGQIPYDKSEIGFGMDKDDVVAIWQSVRGATSLPHKGANRRIIATKPSRAGLAEE